MDMVDMVEKGPAVLHLCVTDIVLRPQQNVSTSGEKGIIVP